jgi:hypothetical protein
MIATPMFSDQTEFSVTTEIGGTNIARFPGKARRFKREAWHSVKIAIGGTPYGRMAI